MAPDIHKVLSFSRAIMMHRNIADVCHALMEVVYSMELVRSVSVYVSHGQVLVLLSKKGGRHLCRRIAIEECAALLTGELMNTEACSHDAPKNATCIPIIGAAEVRGLLTVGGKIDEFSKGLLQSFAGQAGLRLASIQRQNTLEAQAQTDQLTGLFNKRYFEAALAETLFPQGGSEDPTSLLFLDIDHFKSFNDTYGHDVGDEVLHHFGQLLRNAVRPEDIAARWGGEEFAVIMPKTGAAKAFAVAEDLRAEFKKLPVATRGSLSISVGISEAPRCGLTCRDVLRAADAALYRAKIGRDCTELAEPIATAPKRANNVVSPPN